MERLVWVFWEGKSFSLLDITKNLIELKSNEGEGYKVIFLNHKNIVEYVDDIPDCFFLMSYKEQSYYIRTFIISTYGGIYMDLDTIVIHNLDSLFNILNHKESFFIKDEKGKLINKLFGAQINSKFMIKWKNEMMEYLSFNSKSKKQYEFIGNELLNQLYDNYNNKDNIYVFNGPDTLLPISDDNIYDYLKTKDNYTLYKKSLQPCVILNDKIYQHLMKSNCQSIWQSNYVLNHFLDESRKNMIKYNFIEIGTSDFETLIQIAPEEQIGLSIDALSCYLERLPNKKNVKKIHSAITNNRNTDIIKIYYIKPEIIEKYNLPSWLKGCNSVNDYHPLHHEQKVSHLVTIEEVPLKNVSELMMEQNVGGIDYLKTDTEGWDCVIITGFLEWMKLRPREEWPKKILFESNARSAPQDVQTLVTRLTQEFGYKLIYSHHDTLVEL